jgi:hypothetical protein
MCAVYQGWSLQPSADLTVKTAGTLAFGGPVVSFRSVTGAVFETLVTRFTVHCQNLPAKRRGLSPPKNVVRCEPLNEGLFHHTFIRSEKQQHLCCRSSRPRIQQVSLLFHHQAAYDTPDAPDCASAYSSFPWRQSYRTAICCRVGLERQ